jgi:hypothetical protein
MMQRRAYRTPRTTCCVGLLLRQMCWRGLAGVLTPVSRMRMRSFSTTVTTGRMTETGRPIPRGSGGSRAETLRPARELKWTCRAEGSFVGRHLLPTRGAVYRGLGSGVIRGHPLILKRVLDQGYGVAIQIVHPVPNGKRKSHVITLWGYRYDENNPFKGILVTDSDDNKRNKDARQAEDALRYYEVTKRDGMWWFTYDKEEWKILAAYALARRPGIQPGDAQGSRVTPPPLSPPTKSPAHAATPSSCPWSTAKRPQH